MAEHTSPSSPAASATPPAAAASPAASATPPPAANTALHENPTELEENKKRKPTKKSEFQVVRVIESYRTGRYSLKMVKPFSSKIDVNTCPTVCLKEARADDKHAFHIMHGFHHKNILHMKLLAKNVMQNNDPLAAATFVEPYDGKLLSICRISECADEINHIPSPKFQRYVREIVIGIDFLMKNNLYHGNLSWDSTLHSNETVKLAGFKLKELMSDQEAKWNDWLCFTKMLEVISERTHVWNQNVQSNPSLSQSQRVTFFCGILDSLIVMLKGLDCTSLLHMKDIILEDPFFWDFSKRVNFFANTVSLRLSDTNFMNIVRNSAICEKHWETNCASEFKDLVTQIAEYQEDVRMKAEINRQRGAWRGGHHIQSRGRRGGRVRQLGGRRRGNDSKGEQPSDDDFKEHYLRCVCGGYTHHRLMKVNVDWAVRINHPTICIDMKKILDTADGLPSGTQSS